MKKYIFTSEPRSRRRAAHPARAEKEHTRTHTYAPKTPTKTIHYTVSVNFQTLSHFIFWACVSMTTSQLPQVFKCAAFHIYFITASKVWAYDLFWSSRNFWTAVDTFYCLTRRCWFCYVPVLSHVSLLYPNCASVSHRLLLTERGKTRSCWVNP